MHLHLISLDLRSECLKNKKHFNSFATSFLVPPEAFVEQLESSGKVASLGHAAEEARLKVDMRCPIDGRRLTNIPAVKARVTSDEYAGAVRSLEGGVDLVERWPVV